MSKNVGILHFPFNYTKHKGDKKITKNLNYTYFYRFFCLFIESMITWDKTIEEIKKTYKIPETRNKNMRHINFYYFKDPYAKKTPWAKFITEVIIVKLGVAARLKLKVR